MNSVRDKVWPGDRKYRDIEYGNPWLERTLERYVRGKLWDRLVFAVDMTTFYRTMGAVGVGK